MPFDLQAEDLVKAEDHLDFPVPPLPPLPRLPIQRNVPPSKNTSKKTDPNVLFKKVKC